MHRVDTGSLSYAAIDLGAESGRVMLGTLASGHLTMEEVHRFRNEPVCCGDSLRWDVLRLWQEVQQGLEKLPDTHLDGIGVDAWGVDYALLGEGGELLENPHHYRDKRTGGMMERVFRIVTAEQIYARTGIQFMEINTLYQLAAAQLKTPRLLAAADTLLTIPDLFHYWLTGRAACEFTNATTTQMVDPHTRSWAVDLLDRLGLPSTLPARIIEPGSAMGPLLANVSAKFGGTPVIAPATHDTGSAVAAVTARDDTAFISSGTWSLVGIEVDAPVMTDEARRLNFTNEGGVCGTTRLLKNVMGLWMIQGCRKSLAQRGTTHEYGHLVELALQQPPFQHAINPDDRRFLRPDCMLAAIDSFCADTEQPMPQTPGAYLRAVFESLALKYRLVLGDLEGLLGRSLRNIRIIGGGCRNHVLNQFTADATGKRVLAGPVEATALGNIGMQMLASGATSSLQESRTLLEQSFLTTIFEPAHTDQWVKQSKLFEQLCEATSA